MKTKTFKPIAIGTDESEETRFKSNLRLKKRLINEPDLAQQSTWKTMTDNHVIYLMKLQNELVESVKAIV